MQPNICWKVLDEIYTTYFVLQLSSFKVLFKHVYILTEIVLNVEEHLKIKLPEFAAKFTEFIRLMSPDFFREAGDDPAWGDRLQGHGQQDAGEDAVRRAALGVFLPAMFWAANQV